MRQRHITNPQRKECMMKRLQLHALLVALVALALGACSSTKSDMANQASSTRTETSTTTTDTAALPATPAMPSPDSSVTGSAGSNAMPATAATGNSMPDQTGYTPSPAMANANSVVTLIEAMPRQNANAGDMTGSGTSGSSGSGSTAGGANDKVYRVTLHMDDGSTRIITQEVAPTYRAGDRVRLENGMVMR
jgi:outer membrane lipoprotein SlyB